MVEVRDDPKFKDRDVKVQEVFIDGVKVRTDVVYDDPSSGRSYRLKNVTGRIPSGQEVKTEVLRREAEGSTRPGIEFDDPSDQARVEAAIKKARYGQKERTPTGKFKPRLEGREKLKDPTGGTQIVVDPATGRSAIVETKGQEAAIEAGRRQTVYQQRIMQTLKKQGFKARVVPTEKTGKQGQIVAQKPGSERKIIVTAEGDVVTAPKSAEVTGSLRESETKRLKKEFDKEIARQREKEKFVTMAELPYGEAQRVTISQLKYEQQQARFKREAERQERLKTVTAAPKSGLFEKAKFYTGEAIGAAAETAKSYIDVYNESITEIKKGGFEKYTKIVKRKGFSWDSGTFKREYPKTARARDVTVKTAAGLVLFKSFPVLAKTPILFSTAVVAKSAVTGEVPTFRSLARTSGEVAFIIGIEKGFGVARRIVRPKAAPRPRPAPAQQPTRAEKVARLAKEGATKGEREAAIRAMKRMGDRDPLKGLKIIETGPGPQAPTKIGIFARAILKRVDPGNMLLVRAGRRGWRVSKAEQSQRTRTGQTKRERLSKRKDIIVRGKTELGQQYTGEIKRIGTVRTDIDTFGVRIKRQRKRGKIYTEKGIIKGRYETKPKPIITRRMITEQKPIEVIKTTIVDRATKPPTQKTIQQIKVGGQEIGMPKVGRYTKTKRKMLKELKKQYYKEFTQPTTQEKTLRDYKRSAYLKQFGKNITKEYGIRRAGERRVKTAIYYAKNYRDLPGKYEPQVITKILRQPKSQKQPQAIKLSQLDKNIKNLRMGLLKGGEYALNLKQLPGQYRPKIETRLIMTPKGPKHRKSEKLGEIEKRIIKAKYLRESTAKSKEMIKQQNEYLKWKGAQIPKTKLPIKKPTTLKDVEKNIKRLVKEREFDAEIISNIKKLPGIYRIKQPKPKTANLKDIPGQTTRAGFRPGIIRRIKTGKKRGEPVKKTLQDIFGRPKKETYQFYEIDVYRPRGMIPVKPGIKDTAIVPIYKEPKRGLYPVVFFNEKKGVSVIKTPQLPSFKQPLSVRQAATPKLLTSPFVRSKIKTILVTDQKADIISAQDIRPKVDTATMQKQDIDYRFPTPPVYPNQIQITEPTTFPTPIRPPTGQPPKYRPPRQTTPPRYFEPPRYNPPRYEPPRTIPERPYKIIDLDWLTKKKYKSHIQAYDVQVKRFGKFKTIAKSQPIGKALKIGATRTQLTLAATFKLIPKGYTTLQDISYKPSKQIFREFAIRKGTKVPTPLTFIEKRGFRLSSPSEIGEIKKFKTFGGR